VEGTPDPPTEPLKPGESDEPATERIKSSEPAAPTSIAAVSVLLYVYAAFLVLAGVVALLVGAIGDGGPDPNLDGFEIFVAVVNIAFGGALLWVAGGIARGEETARVIWVVLMALDALSGVAALARGYLGFGLFSLIIPLFLIYLVFTPKAEEFFERDGA